MNTEKAIGKMTDVIRRKHLTLSTERSYCAWLRQYCDFVYDIPAHISSEQKLERFLTALAKKDIAASTQNQGFNFMPTSGSSLLSLPSGESPLGTGGSPVLPVPLGTIRVGGRPVATKR